MLQSSITKQSPTSDQAVSASADIASTKKTTIQHSSQQDRRFNVVIYGIEECPKGTARHERSGLDLSNVVKLITKVMKTLILYQFVIYPDWANIKTILYDLDLFLLSLTEPLMYHCYYPKLVPFLTVSGSNLT